jgi:hypothetical protein
VVGLVCAESGNMVRDDVVFNTIQLISSSPNQQVILVEKPASEKFCCKGLCGEYVRVGAVPSVVDPH